MNERQKNIRNFYMSTASIYNVISMLDDDTILNNNWTLGLSDLQRNLEWIDNEVKRMGYNFDYNQAITFRRYLSTSQYLINETKDQLVTKEEGFSTVRISKDLLIHSFKPFAAFVCRRVKEAEVLEFIPESYRKMYYSFNDDFSIADDKFLEVLMDLSMEDADTEGDLEVLEDYLEESQLGLTMEDIAIMQHIMSSSIEQKLIDSSLELDF